MSTATFISCLLFVAIVSALLGYVFGEDAGHNRAVDRLKDGGEG